MHFKNIRKLILAIALFFSFANATAIPTVHAVDINGTGAQGNATSRCGASTIICTYYGTVWNANGAIGNDAGLRLTLVEVAEDGETVTNYIKTKDYSNAVYALFVIFKLFSYKRSKRV